jgi:hypothetical protein
VSKYPKHTGPGSVSLRALVRDLIDYAGLFPPASLSMKQAVGNYQAYLNGSFWWATGVFVLPASRYSEFAQEFIASDAKNWCLSLLVGPDFTNDLQVVAALKTALNGKVIPAYFETKVSSPIEVDRVAAALGSNLLTYYEIPLMNDLAPILRAIKSVHGRAKIRTGGVTSEVFPCSEDVARFIHACHENEVAFKATAGLHHPVRCVKPLTYEPGAPLGTMHGFLNVFLAATACRNGASVKTMTHLLEDRDASHFQFPDDAAYWQDHKFSVDEIENTRDNFAISFGSCSFEEPLADLRELKLL